jgi:hypothetical protein
MVAIRKATGQQNRVHVLQVGAAMPERDGLAANDAHCAHRVAIVERAKERDDADPSQR